MGKGGNYFQAKKLTAQNSYFIYFRWGNKLQWMQDFRRVWKRALSFFYSFCTVHYPPFLSKRCSPSKMPLEKQHHVYAAYTVKSLWILDTSTLLDFCFRLLQWFDKSSRHIYVLILRQRSMLSHNIILKLSRFADKIANSSTVLRGLIYIWCRTNV